MREVSCWVWGYWPGVGCKFGVVAEKEDERKGNGKGGWWVVGAHVSCLGRDCGLLSFGMVGSDGLRPR